MALTPFTRITQREPGCHVNQGVNPKRGEIWRVDLDPTIGAEMQKTRPCIVLSGDNVGRLPLRLVVPLTAWQEHFAGNLWMVKIKATRGTGLTKDSTADAFQLRGVDLARFDTAGPMGKVSDADMEQVMAAVTLTIGK